MSYADEIDAISREQCDERLSDIARLRVALAEAGRLNTSLQEKLKGHAEALVEVFYLSTTAAGDLIQSALRKTAAYPDMCRHPEKCQNGRCEREIACND